MAGSVWRDDNPPARCERGASPMARRVDTVHRPFKACRATVWAQASSITGFDNTPMPGTSTSTQSPARIHNGGRRPAPTPAGVPVETMCCATIREPASVRICISDIRHGRLMNRWRGVSALTPWQRSGWVSCSRSAPGRRGGARRWARSHAPRRSRFWNQARAIAWLLDGAGTVCIRRLSTRPPH